MSDITYTISNLHFPPHENFIPFSGFTIYNSDYYSIKKYIKNLDNIFSNILLSEYENFRKNKIPVYISIYQDNIIIAECSYKYVHIPKLFGFVSRKKIEVKFNKLRLKSSNDYLCEKIMTSYDLQI